MWNINCKYENGNNVFCLLKKGGYCVVVLIDIVYDICLEMCLIMEEMGLVIEVYYYEVVIVG